MSTRSPVFRYWNRRPYRNRFDFFSIFALLLLEICMMASHEPHWMVRTAPWFTGLLKRYFQLLKKKPFRTSESPPSQKKKKTVNTTTYDQTIFVNRIVRDRPHFLFWSPPKWAVKIAKFRVSNFSRTVRGCSCWFLRFSKGTLLIWTYD